MCYWTRIKGLQPSQNSTQPKWNLKLEVIFLMIGLASLVKIIICNSGMIGLACPQDFVFYLFFPDDLTWILMHPTTTFSTIPSYSNRIVKLVFLCIARKVKGAHLKHTK